MKSYVLMWSWAVCPAVSTQMCFVWNVLYLRVVFYVHQTALLFFVFKFKLLKLHVCLAHIA